jgi:phosphatidylglycerol:prolipoprotein diacylglycerol transferase
MAFPDGLVPTTGPNGTCALNGWPQNCAVHPTPIYEFIACVLIYRYIWRRGSRAIQHPLGPGVITGEFLILFGIERFLVEFIRINPRILWGMSNAQLAASISQSRSCPQSPGPRCPAWQPGNQTGIPSRHA